MWHSTAPENIEIILSNGLQVGRESANTMAGAWADEFYGTRPIYLSAEKGKYEGTPLAVNTSGLGLVADLPTLVDTGAYQEEEGMYWDEGSEPQQMIDIVDEDGMVYFDELLSPGSAAAQAAIDLTGTAAVVQDIPSKSISTEEGGLTSNEPSAAESEWASKSQADKDAHVKNAVWETMAWKRYRKHAQAEGIPFDPDNEEDMKVARTWWKEQPESRQFEGAMKITKQQLKRIIKEETGFKGWFLLSPNGNLAKSQKTRTPIWWNDKDDALAAYNSGYGNEGSIPVEVLLVHDTYAYNGYNADPVDLASVREQTTQGAMYEGIRRQIRQILREEGYYNKLPKHHVDGMPWPGSIEDLATEQGRTWGHGALADEKGYHSQVNKSRNLATGNDSTPLRTSRKKLKEMIREIIKELV